MKTRFAVLLLGALFLPAALAHGDESRSANAYGASVLSSGYVTPDSGAPSTSFTYWVFYSNAAKVGPHRIWVGVWWDSLGESLWHEMEPFDPSNTNYKDGVWYTASIRGLDAGDHFFRFVADLDGRFCHWPEPEGSYLAGPTVTDPPVTGLPVRHGEAIAISTSGPQPSLMLQGDRAEVEHGGTVTFTVTLTLPGAYSEVARGVTLAYRPDAMFDLIDGAAPVLIKNRATLSGAWGPVRSPTATVRVEGRAMSIIPAGNAFIADCGDLAPGQTVTCTFRCRTR